MITAEDIDRELIRLTERRHRLDECADPDTMSLYAELTAAIDDLLVQRFEAGPAAHSYV
jgi:hypothetical protein